MLLAPQRNEPCLQAQLRALKVLELFYIFQQKKSLQTKAKFTKPFQTLRNCLRDGHARGPAKQHA